MCNHYRHHPDRIPTWREYAGYDLRPPNEAYAADVWPKYGALIIRREEGLTRTGVMQWGVPTNVKGASGRMLEKRVTNCRNPASPFWKSMMANPVQRCLVPFSAFAEPKIGQGREEWWFAVPKEPVAAFAGIWRNTEHGQCFAFLTCGPNELVAPKHPKAMPVILHPEDYELWLSGDHQSACKLARPFPSERMALG